MKYLFNNLFYTLSPQKKLFIEFMNSITDFDPEVLVFPSNIKNVKYKLLTQKNGLYIIKIRNIDYDLFLIPQQRGSKDHLEVFFRTNPSFFNQDDVLMYYVLDIYSEISIFKKISCITKGNKMPEEHEIIQYSLKNTNFLFNQSANSEINEVYSTILKIFISKKSKYLELKQELLNYCDFYSLKHDINLANDEVLKNFICLQENILKFRKIEYKQKKTELKFA